MAYIHTVTGKVDVEKIHNTDAHSHLIAYATNDLIEKDPDLLLDRLDQYENLILCHLDQLEYFDLHHKIVSKGVFLTYDAIAKAKYQTRERALRYIVTLAKEHFHTQILVGNDFARRSCFEGYGGKPGYHSVFHDFKQELRHELLNTRFTKEEADQIIRDIYIENPKRAFALRKCRGAES